MMDIYFCSKLEGYVAVCIVKFGDKPEDLQDIK